MKSQNTGSERYKVRDEPILAYIVDIEDMRMYPIINYRCPERNAIELPPMRSPASDCHVLPGSGDRLTLLSNGEMLITKEGEIPPDKNLNHKLFGRD